MQSWWQFLNHVQVRSKMKISEVIYLQDLFPKGPGRPITSGIITWRQFHWRVGDNFSPKICPHYNGSEQNFDRLNVYVWVF